MSHQATISVAVLDSTGKVVMESILETKAAIVLEFFAGLRGTLSATLGRLAVRSTQASHRRGVQSAEERFARGREQG